MNNLRLIVNTKNVYGTINVYPVNKAAQIFADIAGTKTLTRDTLTKAKMLGYEIEVCANPLILENL